MSRSNQATAHSVQAEAEAEAEADHADEHDTNNQEAKMATITKDDFSEDPETVYTEQGASHFLGISASNLRALRCAGKGPAFCPVGEKRIMYRRADLVAYLNHRRVIPENEPLLRVFLERVQAEQKTKQPSMFAPQTPLIKPQPAKQQSTPEEISAAYIEALRTLFAAELPPKSAAAPDGKAMLAGMMGITLSPAALEASPEGGNTPPEGSQQP